PSPPPPRPSTLSLHDALPILNVAPVTIYAPPPAQQADGSYTIYGYALDATSSLTTYTAPATLSITSSSSGGTFMAGSTTSVFFVDRKSTRLNSSHLVISYAVF